MGEEFGYSGRGDVEVVFGGGVDEVVFCDWDGGTVDGAKGVERYEETAFSSGTEHCAGDELRSRCLSCHRWG